MSTKPDAVTELLARSERELLALVSEAAKHADYAAIERARTAAQGVRVLLDRLPPGTIPESLSDRKRPPPWRMSRVPAKSVSSGGYPQFAIEGDVLTKTGWSKRDRREYDQKIRREDYERVAAAMRALTAAGRGPFTAHAIVSRVETDGEEKLPDYKIYVALAFWKHGGLIRQVGRDGYQCDQGIELQAKSSWESLAIHATHVNTGTLPRKKS